MEIKESKVLFWGRVMSQQEIGRGLRKWNVLIYSYFNPGEVCTYVGESFTFWSPLVNSLSADNTSLQARSADPWLSLTVYRDGALRGVCSMGIHIWSFYVVTNSIASQRCIITHNWCNNTLMFTLQGKTLKKHLSEHLPTVAFTHCDGWKQVGGQYLSYRWKGKRCLHHQVRKMMRDCALKDEGCKNSKDGI